MDKTKLATSRMERNGKKVLLKGKSWNIVTNWLGEGIMDTEKSKVSSKFLYQVISYMEDALRVLEVKNKEQIWRE